jgi:small GTP-binding protein
MSSSTLVKVKSSFKLKILVVGAANSGKHSFCSKYSDNFSQKFRDIIGVDIYVREETRADGQVTTFSCWNCAPQKKFHYYYSKFFRGALGALILFDISDRGSYEEVEYWINEVRKYIDGIPIILIGNKVDLERKVAYEDVLQFANQKKLAAYIETSTKDDVNISVTFSLLNDIIYNFIRSGESVFNTDDLDPSIKLKIDALRNNYSKF